MFHKIVHLLNWIKTNLFANMGLDLTVIEIEYWRCSASSAILFTYTVAQFDKTLLVGSILCLHYNQRVLPRSSTTILASCWYLLQYFYL